jgi:hypothetical protein
MSEAAQTIKEIVVDADKRIADLEEALVRLIDAVDSGDQRRIDNAMFVGKVLTF